MAGDIVSISGYTTGNQRKETKPSEEFDMSADSHRQAVKQSKDNSPGPAYVLQLSQAAQEILAKKREKQA